jgi:hypothetical protein
MQTVTKNQIVMLSEVTIPTSSVEGRIFVRTRKYKVLARRAATLAT